jgi:hypothetical protein
MFQSVGLYVSSGVITFHRRRGNVGKGKWKNEWRRPENAPNMAHDYKEEIPEKGTTGKNKPRNRRKSGKTSDNKKETPVLCRVESELSLVPTSLWHSIRQAAV